MIEQEDILQDYRPYTDKYFLRAREILEAEGLNPWARAQVFIRRGPGPLAGMEEAIAFIRSHAPNVSIHALPDFQSYDSGETLMTLEGHLQEFIELETVYLGIISEATTCCSVDRELHMEDLADAAEDITHSLVDISGGRPVFYGGARHWYWDEDRFLSEAALRGGAIGCSTDVGAATHNKIGMGTIPHALEAVYHWEYGMGRAVVEATKAFDLHIDSSVPRIALVDYANRELEDSIVVFQEVDNMSAVRVDTCGENTMEQACVQLDGSFVKGDCYTKLPWDTKAVKISYHDRVGRYNTCICW